MTDFRVYILKVSQKYPQSIRCQGFASVIEYNRHVVRMTANRTFS